jgi:hypothetical protein
VGEIDCRLDEGLLKASHSAKDLSALTTQTIADFIRYINHLRQRYPLEISLSGIPACNKPLAQIPHAQAQQLLDLILNFNQQLQQQALQAGMGFLDIFALTNTGQGKANGNEHLDQIHLKPDAYAKAFIQHFTPARSNATENPRSTDPS